MIQQLHECLELMETVAQNRTAAQEQQRIERKNTAFFNAYQEFRKSMCSFLAVQKAFGFMPSSETLSGMRQVTDETRRILQTQNISDVRSYNEQVRICNEQLRQEWDAFIEEYTAELRNGLHMVQLLKDRNMTSASNLLLKLQSRQWSFTDETASDYLDVCRKAGQLLDTMQFDVHISDFLNKIRRNTAVLSDLTPEVMKWLQEHHMTGKISLKISL